MHRTSTLSLVAALFVVAACTDSPSAPTAARTPTPKTLLGNGFPEGAHDYQLLLIGVPKDKTADMDNNNGRRIFVQLESDNVVTNPGGKNNDLTKGGGNDQNHIYLCNSTDGANDVADTRCDTWRATNAGQFGVIDANATDGDGAIFGLPDPCVDDNSTTPCTPGYRIFARALGPGGNATITTCADENPAFDLQDDVWCGSNGITLEAKGASRKAVEVTNNLLYMTITVNDALDPQLAACIDPDGDAIDGAPDTYDVYLFDRCFENYFWNYDNNGLKLLQLRFYAA